MIRPLTFLCMLLAACSGLYLYQVKNRTRLLDRQIAQVMKTADTTRARTAVLQAEWALQNDPERLQDLADRFLTLRPVSPGQFITLAELDHRLPPISIPPTPTNDDTDTSSEPPASVAARSDPLEPARPVPNPDPAIKAVVAPAPKMAPVPPVMIAIRPTPTPVANIALPPIRPAAPPPHAVVAASTPVTVAATNPPRPRYDSNPTGNSASEVINRIIRSSRQEASAPTVGSVLGAARTTLAPPVPVPVASAETASYVAPR